MEHNNDQSSVYKDGNIFVEFIYSKDLINDFQPNIRFTCSRGLTMYSRFWNYHIQVIQMICTHGSIYRIGLIGFPCKLLQYLITPTNTINRINVLDIGRYFMAGGGNGLRYFITVGVNGLDWVGERSTYRLFFGIIWCRVCLL